MSFPALHWREISASCQIEVHDQDPANARGRGPSLVAGKIAWPRMPGDGKEGPLNHMLSRMSFTFVDVVKVYASKRSYVCVSREGVILHAVLPEVRRVSRTSGFEIA